jgi:hypothetical protein
MRGIVLASNNHGCDLGWFYRPSRLRVIEERHLRTGFHHGICCIRAAFSLVTAAPAGPEPGASIDDQPVEVVVDLGCGHLAPSSPLRRQSEAEEIKLLLAGYPLIFLGDLNGVPAEGDDPPTQGIDPAQARRKLDRGAARALQEIGLVDVGHRLGDTAPTVGHLRADRLAYRCDRIYSTLPADTFIDHRVAEGGESDHRLVEAAFDLTRGDPTMRSSHAK